MPTTDIVIDAYHLLDAQKATIIVKGIQDYPRACLALKDAIHSNNSISIHVWDHTVTTWLSQFTQAYGETHVLIRSYTLHDALADRWRVTVPSSISDNDILQSKLFDIPIVARESQDFWEVLLEHFYGIGLTYRNFPQGNISVILNNFHKTQWKEAAQRPIVVQAQRDKLTQWERTASSEAIKTLIQCLADDPAVLRRNLLAFKLLRNYPTSVRRKVLEDYDWETFSKVNMDLENLEVEDPKKDVALAVQEIDYYLADASNQITKVEDVEKLTQQMSGYLDEEFYVIEALFQRYPEYLTAGLLQDIEQRFDLIKTRIESSMAKLRRMLRPELPMAPNSTWEIAEWLIWITDSYMPYYSWLDAQAKRDELVASYAFMFADWFYQNFVNIKNASPQHFAFNALYQERERIAENDAITLVLIVDNLNFAYFNELRRQFNLQGFSLKDIKPVLSLIPTATEIGKKALIAVDGDQKEFSKDRFPKLVAKVWGAVLEGKKVKYLPNIGELQQEHILTHDLYFLNYLPIDQALHKDDRDIGRPHSEVIHEAITTLAKVVVDFAKRFRIEHRLHVYVISDHGSTRIPQHIVNVIDKKFFKTLSDEKHHRFIPLSDSEFTKLPQVASTQCYFIDRQTFKTDKNYLIARQYYRFIETQENFYVHGGLTPEEVVVPFARFTHEPVITVTPTLYLLTKLFRYSIKSEVMLELGNPNAFPLEAISIRLVDADADEVFISTIDAKQIMPIKFYTTFRRVKGTTNSRSLTVRVRYECQGQKSSPQDQTFEITMKSLMEVTDDNFDF